MGAGFVAAPATAVKLQQAMGIADKQRAVAALGHAPVLGVAP